MFEKDEIKGRVLEHFSAAFKGQEAPAYTNADAQRSHVEEEQLNSDMPEKPTVFAKEQFEAKICAPYSMFELNEILDALPDGKAAGLRHF